MKKKIIISIVILPIVIFLIVALCVALGHKHSYEITEILPSVEARGCTLYTCSCGHSYEENIVPALTPAQGLQYELNNDGASYSVIGIGTCEDVNINIPIEHEGKPVTQILEHAFADCVFIESITVSNKIDYIGQGAFMNCISLKEIRMGNSVSKIGSYAFSGCASLEKVTFNSSVSKIDSMAFEGCAKLESITLPEKITIISFGMFKDCSSLKCISLSKNIENIDLFAFEGCVSLEFIEVDDNNKFYQSIDGNVYSKDGKIFHIYAVGKNNEEFIVPNHVSTVKAAAFEDSKLKKIYVPSSVEIIENDAFKGCNLLEMICCEAESKPDAFGEYWNIYAKLGQKTEIPVVWGYKEN